MIHILNLEFDLQEVLDYYNTLENDYQKYRWQFYDDHNNPAVIDPKNDVNKIYGWGLQTTYHDTEFVYHCDLDPHNEPPEYFKDTPMVFGFFDKIKNRFKQPFRSFVHVFPPGQYIGKWMPTPPPHVKIMIPIIMNNSYKLTVHGPNPVTVIPEPGKIYMIESTHLNEWRNDGDSKIAYILFSVPLEYMDEMLNFKGKL